MQVSNHVTVGDLMVLYAAPRPYVHLITSKLPQRITQACPSLTSYVQLLCVARSNSPACRSPCCRQPLPCHKLSVASCICRFSGLLACAPVLLFCICLAAKAASSI